MSSSEIGSHESLEAGEQIWRSVKAGFPVPTGQPTSISWAFTHVRLFF